MTRETASHAGRSPRRLISMSGRSLLRGRMAPDHHPAGMSRRVGAREVDTERLEPQARSARVQSVEDSQYAKVSTRL